MVEVDIMMEAVAQKVSVNISYVDVLLLQMSQHVAVLHGFGAYSIGHESADIQSLWNVIYLNIWLVSISLEQMIVMHL
jgi:NADH:ubiquinone oxidoreductase subunit F (NADH-binding)